MLEIKPLIRYKYLHFPEEKWKHRVSIRYSGISQLVDGKAGGKPEKQDSTADILHPPSSTVPPALSRAVFKVFVFEPHPATVY